MDEKDLKKIAEFLPQLSKEFFSKFPAKDNHRLNLYSDFLGFLAALVVTYVVLKILSPFSNAEDAAWRIVKTLMITWGLWFLFMIWCIRTTFFKDS